MPKSFRIAFFTPLYDGTEKESQTFGSLLKNLLIVSIGYFGFIFCLTILYHAMRGVMDLGGLVSSLVFIINLGGVAAGIYLAISFFRSLT